MCVCVCVGGGVICFIVCGYVNDQTTYKNVSPDILGMGGERIISF